MCPGTIAIAALAVATVGTGVSIYQGQQSAKAQANAINLQKQQQDLQAARQKRDAVRSARVAYAAAQQGAENQGASMTSNSMGGLASIDSQLSSNLSFLDQYKELGDQASTSLGAANKYAASSRMWGQVASAASNVAGNPEGTAKSFAQVQKVFGGS